jgi:molybdate/tungstate transport system substrate-binding protein
MFDGRFRRPVTIFMDDALTTISVPEIVEPVPDTGLVIRGASIQLIALLQTGELDYAFEYESVIRQHGLEMLSLPDALNLGSPEVDYSGVLVEMDFQRFQSVQPVFRGERIGYGITVPSNAPHPEEAALFIAFLLSEEGRAVMLADQHPLFEQALADGYDRLPPVLQALCIPAETP